MSKFAAFFLLLATAAQANDVVTYDCQRIDLYGRASDYSSEKESDLRFSVSLDDLGESELQKHFDDRHMKLDQYSVSRDGTVKLTFLVKEKYQYAAEELEITLTRSVLNARPGRHIKIETRLGRNVSGGYYSVVPHACEVL